MTRFEGSLADPILGIEGARLLGGAELSPAGVRNIVEDAVTTRVRQRLALDEAALVRQRLEESRYITTDQRLADEQRAAELAVLHSDSNAVVETIAYVLQHVVKAETTTPWGEVINDAAGRLYEEELAKQAVDTIRDLN